MADPQSSGRSPSITHSFTHPSSVSKSDILATPNTELDFDQDTDDDQKDPGYAECTCIQYKAPSPPPLDACRRPLPPPPPPPPPLHTLPTQSTTSPVPVPMPAPEDGKDEDEDALYFPTSLSERYSQNLEANLRPRLDAQRQNQQYQQLRKVRDPPVHEKICDASTTTTKSVDNFHSHPTNPHHPSPLASSSPARRLRTILVRPSAKQHVLVAEGQQDQAPEKEKDRYRSRSISPPSSSSETASKKQPPTKSRRGSGILKNKVTPADPSKVRFSLFYTWSFSGQHRRRPELLLALPPPPPPPPPPQPVADPLALTFSSHHSRSYSVRHPLTHYRPQSSGFLATMPRDYHSGKRSRSAFSTAPRNLNRQNATLSYSTRTLRPSQYCPPPQAATTPYTCYSTISDAPQVYRNIFPYTTLYRPTPSYQQQSYQQAYQAPTTAFYGQTTQTAAAAAAAAAELARSFRRQHRYHVTTGSGQTPLTDVYVSDAGTIPYHAYSTMYGPANVASSSQPWTGVMEDATNAAVAIEKVVEQTMNEEGENESIAENGRCSSRACLIGWMLALTAVIILALAIGLFIQISRESTRFEQLQRRQQDQGTGTTHVWERQSTFF